ncbi:MAG: serine/threonine protein kinase [Chthoniobacteraceae bacterium]|nr:serine/threonine protein kinase [Chthoniobacteraceae bacterium]
MQAAPPLSKLEKRYQLHSALGHGGAGEVFTAWDSQLERTVAIKKLKATGIHEDLIQSTWKEAMHLAAIRHSNIVAVYDIGLDGDTPYVVMEYVQGDTIEARVPKGVLTGDEFAKVASQSLEGLLAAHHAGLVHRDIKPSNLMISMLPSGALQVKILDFGIAKFHTRPSHLDFNTDGTVTGSIHCISPEQLTSDLVDNRSDLYSLGCVFYYALAGIYPFEANQVSRIITAHLEHEVIPLSCYRPDLPETVCDWVMKLINRHPTDRYQNAMQALGALQTALSPESKINVSAPAPRIPSFRKQRPGVKMAVMAGFGVLALVAAAAFLHERTGKVRPTLSDTQQVSKDFAPTPVPELVSAPHLEKETPTVVAAENAEPAEVAKQKVPPPSGQSAASLEIANVVLRIHGSNTIGAKLLPALMEKFLQKEGVTEINWTPSINAEEMVVQARFPDTGRGRIEIAAHGSTTAFEGLTSQSCEIGMSSRPIKAEEARACAMAGLGDMNSPECEHVLGLDGIAILVHRDNPLTALSKEQVADIFTGRTVDWAQVGGAAGHIRIYARDGNSGTFDTFKSLVLGGLPMMPAAESFEDSAALSKAVAADPCGIGFTGLAFVGATKVLAVSEAGSPPFLATRFTVATEDYVLSRRLFLYTPAVPQSAWVAKFVEFALSEEGQEMVQRIGFVKQTIDLQRPLVAAAAPADYKAAVRNADRLSLNFRFRAGSVDLDTKAVRDLDRIVQMLSEPRYYGRQLLLLGFTDGNGAGPANLKVSKGRAQGVAHHLIARGIHPALVAGFGATSAVASNETQSGRDKNRRVEVWLR